MARPQRSTHARCDANQPAHVVGIWKTPYGLVTRPCLECRHDVPTRTSADPSDSADPCRRARLRGRGDPRSRWFWGPGVFVLVLRPAVGVGETDILIIAGGIAHRRPSHAASRTRRG